MPLSDDDDYHTSLRFYHLLAMCVRYKQMIQEAYLPEYTLEELVELRELAYKRVERYKTSQSLK